MNAGFELLNEKGDTAQVSADYPVAFAETIGLFRPADAWGEPATIADTAVLFVGSWGFEELCARKFWQKLAVELSKCGLASMRFDYPGTGDALDHPDYAAGLDVWLDTIIAAGKTLKDLSGAKRLLLVGHGIGGALAWRAAEKLNDVSGLVLAAPALSGRHWLREFVALSRIANQGAIATSTAASSLSTKVADGADGSAAWSGPLPSYQKGDGFTETPVRFGDRDRLYGVVCEPEGPRRGATVLLLPTGYERASGWGRISANLCRDLARSGIASLRFDMANIADSPAVPGRPERIVYGEAQLADVDAAMDFLTEKKLLPVVVTGRCSGGWAAFRSGVRDRRFSGVIPVNVFDFYIPPDADVEALLISSRQPLASYGAKLLRGSFWRRVLKGEVRIRNGIVNLWAMIMGKALSFATPIMVRFPFLSARFHQLSQDFNAIAANDTRMSIVFTEGDIGAAMLETNFGPRGRLLTSRYGSPRIAFIENADHNLTTAEARHAWADEVRAIALQFPPAHGNALAP